MRYIALFQMLVLLAVLSALAWIAYKLFGGGIMQGAQWLKDETPLGLPSRAIDTGIQNVSGGAAAGGEDTLGGVAARIAEWWRGEDFSPVFPKPGSANTSPYSINPRERS